MDGIEAEEDVVMLDLESTEGSRGRGVEKNRSEWRSYLELIDEDGDGVKLVVWVRRVSHGGLRWRRRVAQAGGRMLRRREGVDGWTGGC